MKRIVTIQDISCVGKCSLTVALPIISAMGIEASIIPTAVLSAHTIFEGHTFKDLTNEIAPISEHWKKEGFDFDAIYTGYLGSKKQIDIVSKFFDDFKTDGNFIFVDPAMADGGVLYPHFDDSFVEKMKRLCSRADVISPNLTEAALLTGCEYKKEYDRNYIQSIVYSLVENGSKKRYPYRNCTRRKIRNRFVRRQRVRLLYSRKNRQSFLRHGRHFFFRLRGRTNAGKTVEAGSKDCRRLHIGKHKCKRFQSRHKILRR